MSDDNISGDPERPKNPDPQSPELPSAPDAQPTADAQHASPDALPSAPDADSTADARPASRDALPSAPDADSTADARPASPDALSGAPDAQPTTPLPPMADQPTEPYAPAPTFPPGQPVPGAMPAQPSASDAWPPAQSAPEWHASQFATGGVATAPSARKGMAITALSLGIAAVVFALLGFVPIIGFGFLGLGFLLGVVALILGIISIVRANNAGRGMAMTGLILGAVGVVLAIVAIVAQVAFIGAIAKAASSNDDTGSSAQVTPTPESSALTTPQASPAPSTNAGNYDEQAYLGEVKPQLLDIWKTIQPSATSLPWSDDFLVSAGQQIVSLGSDSAARKAMKAAFVKAATSQSKGVLTASEASQIFDVLAKGADDHLVK